MILTFEQNVLITREYVIAFLTVLFWEFLATLPLEFRCVWKSTKWTPVKSLYLATRYWTVFAQIWCAVMLLGHVSADFCSNAYWTVLVGGVGILLLCDSIVAMRVYAVWERDRRVLSLLLALLAGEVAGLVFSTSQLRAVRLPEQVADQIGFHGCSAGNPRMNHTIVALLFWTPTLIFNAIALVLIVWRHLALSRTSGEVPVLRRLSRDGAFYFAVIVAADVPNIYFCIQNDPTLESTHIFASLVLKSVMCQRLVLSLLARPPPVRAKPKQDRHSGGITSLWSSRNPSATPRQSGQTLPTFRYHDFDSTPDKRLLTPSETPTVDVPEKAASKSLFSKWTIRSGGSQGPRATTQEALESVNVLESDAMSPVSSTLCGIGSETSGPTKP
ncbi:hypothetical protein JCM10212_001432 [Sporobolomyces blumeae]